MINPPPEWPQLDVKLFKYHRCDPPPGWRELAAFTCDRWPCRDERIVFVKVGQPEVLRILEHETLHVVISRLGLSWIGLDCLHDPDHCVHFPRTAADYDP